MRWKNLPGLLSGDFREVAAIASLLLADRSRNTAAIAAAIDPVLRDNPNANLLEIEQAFRDSAAAAYLVATTERFEVGLGLMAMLAAVAKASAIHFTPTSASWTIRSNAIDGVFEIDRGVPSSHRGSSRDSGQSAPCVE